ncbi:hypothetical protein ACSFC1_04340 [Pseudothermotoga sp. U03pept]|uniref:hypothetical protein n=1 Tax=Pseudothermotoga sp. U03pept TaxID=3447012 RepID=UPI003F096CCC
MKLYPVKYKFKRAYLSIVIFSIVAAMNSFIKRVSVGVLSSVIGLVIVIILYKDVFKQLVKDFLELWILVARR